MSRRFSALHLAIHRRLPIHDAVWAWFVIARMCWHSCTGYWLSSEKSQRNASKPIYRLVIYAQCLWTWKPSAFRRTDRELKSDWKAGPGSSVGCASAWYSDGGRFDPTVRQNILSLRLIMKPFLQPFSLYTDSSRALVSCCWQKDVH